MQKQKSVSLILIFVWLLALLTFAQRKPNIIIIISDDHAYQAIGAYGNKYGATPNLDKLASQGMRFDRAFVTNSICGPSRAAILTARYSHINGFRDNGNVFDGNQPSFIKQLQASGYNTAWIGKWHLQTKPQGFNYWKVLPGQGNYYNPYFINMDSVREQHKGYTTDVITDLSMRWLKERDNTKPFCLVVGHKAVHRNWLPDTSDLRAFDQTVFTLPNNFYDDYTGRKAAALQDMSISETMRLGYDLKMLRDTGFGKAEFGTMNANEKAAYDAYYNPIYHDLIKQNLKGRSLTEWKYQRYMRDYMACVLSLDRNIGRLMDFTKQQQLDDNTIVIYISDQGFYLGEHGWFDKRFMYEESMRTPLIMRYPPSIKAGSVNSSLALNIDLGPTLLDAIGLAPSYHMQGISLWQNITRARALEREALYYHYYEWGTHSVRPHFGVRTSRYKLIRFYSADYNGWEFFDLENDISEMKNLIASKEHASLITVMKRQCLALAKQYEDNEVVDMLKEEGIN